MRLAPATFAAAAVLATAVVAQPGADSQSLALTNKPADDPQSTGSVEPVASSFTEDQARSRIEAQGFNDVTELHKDDQGIRRGKAMRNGQSVSVAVDHKGIVQAQ
jgi:periplasmic protein CpxP/Spy